MSPIHHLGRANKRMGDRLRFVTFRVRCIVWVDRSENGPLEGFGFAADISDDGAGIYLDARIPKGAAVRVSLEDENSTPYQGVVAWCQRHSLQQRFLGHPKLDHRIGVQWIFTSEAERQRYLMALNDLRRRATEVVGKMRF